MKNKNKKIISEHKIKCIPAHVVTQRKICFREAASIIKLVHEHDCEATLITGSKSADTNSILSIIGLRITVGTSLVVKIEGDTEEDTISAMRDVLNLLNTPEE